MADSDAKTLLGTGERFFSGHGFPFLILLAAAIALSGIWQWYFSRVVNSADGVYGIFALFAVVILAVRGTTRIGRGSSILPVVSGALLLFAATYDFFPPLLQGMMAFTVLGCLISWWRFGRIFDLGVWSLLVLSLPSISSLQFFFGYPLRVMVGEATRFLLRLNGLFVIRDGVGLNLGEKTIWIDAPCSGIKMLWAGFFLTALLVTLYRFDPLRSILAFVIAFAVILTGNVFRAAGLFYLEAEIFRMPAFAHDGIGVVSFVLTCAGIAFVLQKIRPAAGKQSDGGENLRLTPAAGWMMIFVVSCIAAFYVQAAKSERLPAAIPAESVRFPATFEDRPLTELGLTEIEEYFMVDFPGVVKRFSDGEREIIIRYVREATRKLHSPGDCLGALGYEISPLPLKIDRQNNKWACFKATKGERKLKVCERIYTTTGESWTDVSYWYWSALRTGNPNGYWAVAIAENAPE